MRGERWRSEKGRFRHFIVGRLQAISAAGFLLQSPNGIISFAARVFDSDLRGLPSDRTFQLILHTLHLSFILNRAYSRGIEYLLRYVDGILKLYKRLELAFPTKYVDAAKTQSSSGRDMKTDCKRAHKTYTNEAFAPNERHAFCPPKMVRLEYLLLKGTLAIPVSLPCTHSSYSTPPCSKISSP